MGSGDWTQAVRLGGRCLYPLSHAISAKVLSANLKCCKEHGVSHQHSSIGKSKWGGANHLINDTWVNLANHSEYKLLIV